MRRLPVAACRRAGARRFRARPGRGWAGRAGGALWRRASRAAFAAAKPPPCRSEEPTSVLQSLMRISYVVFCLKKNIITNAPLNFHILHDNTTLRLPPDDYVSSFITL